MPPKNVARTHVFPILWDIPERPCIWGQVLDGTKRRPVLEDRACMSNARNRLGALAAPALRQGFALHAFLRKELSAANMRFSQKALGPNLSPSPLVAYDIHKSPKDLHPDHAGAPECKNALRGSSVEEWRNLGETRHSEKAQQVTF